MTRTIDWEELARELGLLHEQGESSGSDEARRALEKILGEEALRSSVDHYVAREDGSELVRSVLRLTRPWCAMKRCHEIYQQSDDLDRRRSAVELLRTTADRRALDWVPEMMGDPDVGVQNWAVEILEQLYFSGLVELDEIEELLALGERHHNEHVRKTVGAVRELADERGAMSDRREDDPQPS